MNLFISSLLTDPWYYFSWVIIVAFSVCVHEYAHAAVALKCGDDTAAQEGHLTLNPLVQMGPMSLGLLFVIGIAWGSVPVNPSRFSKRTDGALVAFAGPAANLGLAFLFAGIGTAVGSKTMVSDFLVFACVANGVLFVLNMLPIPMFDGWSVCALLIPKMENIEPQQAQNISLFALVLLFVTSLFELVWRGGEALAATMMGFWAQVFGLFL